MRQTIEDLGRDAASNGKPVVIRAGQALAADWLVERGFAAWTSENRLVLLSSSLESKTTMAMPKLVPLGDSLFGLRKQLMQRGWTPTFARVPASVSSKTFRCQSLVKQYFELLLTRILASVDNSLPLLAYTILYTIFSDRKSVV